MVRRGELDVLLDRLRAWGEQSADYLFGTMPRHKGSFNAAASTGILRRRLPVAAKIAIGHCRNDGRSAALAHPARRLEILHNMNVDGRRLVHAKDLVRVEVGLFDTPVLERDLAVERGRDP